MGPNSTLNNNLGQFKVLYKLINVAGTVKLSMPSGGCAVIIVRNLNALDDALGFYVVSQYANAGVDRFLIKSILASSQITVTKAAELDGVKITTTEAGGMQVHVLAIRGSGMTLE